MSIPDECAEVFHAHGRPLSFKDYPSWDREFFKRQLEIFRALDPSVRVCFLENLNFNAVATKRVSGEFIGVYPGALSYLTIASLQIFADPTMYPQIGNSSEEIERGDVSNLLRPGNLATAATLDFMPKDPTRRRLSSRIAECACLLLLYHEAAHIAGCHLDLISDVTGISEHREINATAVSAEHSLLLRALELEADSVALVNSLASWRDLFSAGVYDVGELGVTRSWLIAAELLFWAMSFHDRHFRRMSLASHPRVLTRLLNMRQILGGGGTVDEGLVSAFDWQRPSYIPRWVARHQLSSSIVESIRDSPNESVEELMTLNAERELLWSKLEAHQARRAQRLRTSGVTTKWAQPGDV